jgi:hypothetical protein
MSSREDGVIIALFFDNYPGTILWLFTLDYPDFSQTQKKAEFRTAKMYI